MTILNHTQPILAMVSWLVLFPGLVCILTDCTIALVTTQIYVRVVWLGKVGYCLNY